MKTAILIDFDDTISNLSDFRETQNEFWAQNLSAKTARNLTKNLEISHKIPGTIFAPQKFFSRAEWKIYDEFLRENLPKFVFEDFRNFIKNLDFQKFSPMIFTFGDFEYQREKISASGVNLPIILTKNKNKSAEILKFWRENLQNSEDLENSKNLKKSNDLKNLKNSKNSKAIFYEISGEKFAKIILIDDREYNFFGFEKLQNARGFLLNRAGNSRKIDEKFWRKNLAKNVKIAKSFDEIEI